MAPILVRLVASFNALQFPRSARPPRSYVLNGDLSALGAGEPAQLGKLIFGVLLAVRRAYSGINGRSHNTAPVSIELFRENKPTGT
jgi:hypothetical protein